MNLLAPGRLDDANASFRNRKAIWHPNGFLRAVQGGRSSPLNGGSLSTGLPGERFRFALHPGVIPVRCDSTSGLAIYHSSSIKSDENCVCGDRRMQSMTTALLRRRQLCRGRLGRTMEVLRTLVAPTSHAKADQPLADRAGTFFRRLLGEQMTIPSSVTRSLLVRHFSNSAALETGTTGSSAPQIKRVGIMIA